MTDLIKQVKIKNPDNETSEYIPIGADAKNVFLSSGTNVEDAINNFKSTKYYENIASLKNDVSLKTGSVVETLGYYNAGDGGQGKYYIVSGDYTADNAVIHTLGNGLFAKLDTSRGISSKQAGITSNIVVNKVALDALLAYCGSNRIPFYIDDDIKIDNPIDISVSNVHILGKDGVRIIIDIDANDESSETFYIFKIKNSTSRLKNITIENLEFYKRWTKETSGAEEKYYMDVISSDSDAEEIYFNKVKFTSDSRINAQGLGRIIFNECDIGNHDGFIHIFNNSWIIFNKCIFDVYTGDDYTHMAASNNTIVEFLGGVVKDGGIYITSSSSKVTHAGLLNTGSSNIIEIETITE